MKKLITTIAILLIATASYAETITFTSGKVIEGEIVERTDELIKVDTSAGKKERDRPKKGQDNPLD